MVCKCGHLLNNHYVQCRSRGRPVKYNKRACMECKCNMYNKEGNTG